MKKILTGLLFCLVCLTSYAQTTTRAFNQKLFDAKLEEMVYQLHITESQRPTFTQIYEDFSRDMIRVWNDNQPISDDQVEVLRARIARQQQGQAIRLSYLDRLASVLNDEQLARFFEVEKNIQKRLKDRVTKH